MLSTRIFYSLIAVACVIGASTTAHAQTTALRGARIIDGTGGAAIDNATIVIRDGRIVAIGPSAGTPVPGDAEVVDYAGKTIIPGLISAHSHVGISVGLKAAAENYNRDAILRQLKQLEAYGVTTVMSLGLNGPLFYELRPELHAGKLPGADLFGADQGIGVVGGQPSAAVVRVAESQISRPDTVELARESIRQMAAR
jgi:imidazolonepropionase-like amidohydrolase